MEGGGCHALPPLPSSSRRTPTLSMLTRPFRSLSRRVCRAHALPILLLRCVTSARAPHSGAAAGRPATRNIPTTPAAAGTSVCVFGGFHLASQSLSPRNPLHVPPPASAAPLSPLPSPTGSRSSPRRCVWAGDAVSVPPHPRLLCACSRLCSEVLWRHAAPAHCILLLLGVCYCEALRQPCSLPDVESPSAHQAF